MKKVFLLLFVFGCVFNMTTIEAQKASKEEIKKWKDMAKDYKKNPLKLRDKIEGYNRTITELNEKYNSLKIESENKVSNEEKLQAEIDAKNAEIELLKKQMADLQYVDESNGQDPANGLAFFVQMGAYEVFNINHYFEGIKCMNVQINDDLNKYVIGSFADPVQAESFKTDVQKLGIEDAWVVPILDGKRIPMEDALQLLEGMSFLSEADLNYLKEKYGIF
jgi:cell division protein FtsB